MADKMIKRHTGISIFIHWFNAVCWLILLITGVGLISNTDLNPVGAWWPEMIRGMLGGGESLLWIHVTFGSIWIIVFFLFGISAVRGYTIPFIKEIFSFSPSNDILWLIKKGIQMTLGYKFMAWLGFEPRIPDQGFYNVGQKMFAIPALLGSAVIGLTGIIMIASKFYSINQAVVQWSILVHFLVVGAVFAGLLIHVFMASIAKGELPALISMFTGTVPTEYAKHHHKLWYEEVKDQTD